MKLVRDSPLSIGWRAWDFSRGQRRVIVTVKATVELSRGGVSSLAQEQELVTGDLFWGDDIERTVRYASDLAVVKPEGELWLTGVLRTAEPVRELACRARVGEIEARFSVIGDRRWRADGGVTAPEPFQEMELGWERSFGGPGFSANPAGRGIAPDASGAVALPNIEQAGRLIRSPRARPEPVGAWPVPRTWPERASLMGTYGASYARDRWPYLASDFAWGYFQASREPLRVRDYWRGDEEVELYNLHPEHARLRCRLPGLKPRVFLQAAQRAEGAARLSEVGVVLDTIAIDAGDGRARLVWRGSAPCATESLEEFEHIYLTHEALDAPRSSQAYLASFESALRALDEEERAFEAEPPPAPVEPAPVEPAPVEPAPVEPAPVEPATPQRLREERRREALARGLPAEVVDTLYPAEVTAPEPRSPAELRAQIVDAIESARSLHSPHVVRGLEDMLRAHDAHDEPEAKAEERPSPEPPPGLWTAQQLRDQVRRRVGLGESLSGLNLAGADLSLLDLSGQDLSGALLQGAELRASNLDGANLDGAHLDRAQVDQASLRGATLRGASLAFVEASGACFSGAVLEDAVFDHAVLVGADFTRVRARGVSIERCLATRANFEEAQLEESELARSNFDEASFRRASMMDARLEGSSLLRACLDQLDAPGLRASDGADLSEARVRWAKLAGATFSESTLIGAKFTESDLTRATFAGARMEGAELLAVKARGGSFASARLAAAALAGADLLGARFEGSDLRLADLSGANLYQAEFWRADTTGARLDGANVEGSKLA